MTPLTINRSDAVALLRVLGYATADVMDTDQLEARIANVLWVKSLVPLAPPVQATLDAVVEANKQGRPLVIGRSDKLSRGQ